MWGHADTTTRSRKITKRGITFRRAFGGPAAARAADDTEVVAPLTAWIQGARRRSHVSPPFRSATTPKSASSMRTKAS